MWTLCHMNLALSSLWVHQTQGRKKMLPPSEISSKGATIEQDYLKIIRASFINIKSGCEHCHMNLALCSLWEHIKHKGGKKDAALYYLKIICTLLSFSKFVLLFLYCQLFPHLKFLRSYNLMRVGVGLWQYLRKSSRGRVDEGMPCAGQLSKWNWVRVRVSWVWTFFR